MSGIPPKVGSDPVPSSAVQIQQEPQTPAPSSIPNDQPAAAIPADKMDTKAFAQARLAENNISTVARQIQLHTRTAQAGPIASPSRTPTKTANEHFQDAVKRNDLKKMDEWIKKGADVNAKDKDGKTPLMHAASSSKLEAMDALVNKYKANVALTDSKGQTALSHAAAKGQSGAVNMLLKFRPNVVDKQDNAGNTPLMHAVKAGQSEVAKTLLTTGKADPNITDYDGRTPLMEGIRKRDKESFNLLLRSGAMVDLQDQNGKTALMEAIERY